jgi:hypothetical protein
MKMKQPSRKKESGQRQDPPPRDKCEECLKDLLK